MKVSCHESSQYFTIDTTCPFAWKVISFECVQIGEDEDEDETEVEDDEECSYSMNLSHTLEDRSLVHLDGR